MRTLIAILVVFFLAAVAIAISLFLWPDTVASVVESEPFEWTILLLAVLAYVKIKSYLKPYEDE